ncbi:MAG TPA: hypothetical protein PLK90_10665 [Clostridiales bacterium]|nr:hypothetical protein [Clostridiales bacterium]HQP70851.1 hypothetical protein [Clostridiales bacterium]
MNRYCFKILILVLVQLNSATLLKINSADILKQNPLGGKTIYGNIDIEYDIYRVKCDSAVIDRDMTNARLFRNILFSDTSRTIKCSNATLSKTPNGKLAYLSGDIRITEKDFLITGKNASMNEINNSVSVYDSVIVKYYSYMSALWCKRLEYDTKNDIVTSNDVDSVLYIDSLRYARLKTREFRYDVRKELLSFDSRFNVESHEFIDPYMDFRKADPAKISKIVQKLPVKKDAFFSAERGKFLFENLDVETIGKCSFTQIDRLEQDTIYFKADRIKYNEELARGDAYGKVNIKQNKLNIDTKHASYDQKTGTVKFFDRPIITYEYHTVTGDSVSLVMDEKETYPKEGTVYGNPYFESKPDKENPDELDFLKGKLMNLWFSDKEISKIIVSKEAEGLYFIRREKKKTSEASNYLLGDEIIINFKNGDIDNASIISGCEGIYYPDKIKREGLKKKK